MKAEQARELANSKKKSLSDVRYNIECMAKNGNDYCTIELKSIQNIAEVEKALIDDGYMVSIGNGYLSIKW